MHGLEVLIWTERGCAAAMLHNVTVIYSDGNETTFESIHWDESITYHDLLKFETWPETEIASYFTKKTHE